jgi:hypothetical protein
LISSSVSEALRSFKIMGTSYPTISYPRRLACLPVSLESLFKVSSFLSHCICVKPYFFHLTAFLSWFLYPWPHTKGTINRDFAVCWNCCLMKGETGVYNTNPS